MTAAMKEEWGPPPRELPIVVEVAPSPPRPPGWALLAVFPLAVLLTVFAIGGAGGRTPEAVRVDVRDASGDLARASRVADRLAAVGMSIVSLRTVGDAGGGLSHTEIRYRGNSEEGLVRAKAVRQALGTGSIVRSPDAASGVDVILVIGKDGQNE